MKYETSTKLVRISDTNWKLFKSIKRFTNMTADDVIDELVEFWLRCHEP